MKTTISIAILLFSLAAIVVACAKKADKTPPAASKPIGKSFVPAASFYQLWLHSRTEDKEGITVYRPTDGSFQFPPTRGGGRGYKFAKDGKGASTYPGPTDAIEENPMKWLVIDQNSSRLLTITQQDNEQKTVTKTFKIVALDDKIMQLQEIVR
jgi:hypothetical protein